MPSGQPLRERHSSARDHAEAKIIGRVLREIRTDAGLSLQQVTESCDGLVKYSVLGAYERGERMVSLDRLLQLARIYQVDPGVLISIIEKRIQNPQLTGEVVSVAD